MHFDCIGRKDGDSYDGTQILPLIVDTFSKCVLLCYQKIYQLPVVDGYDHVVVAGYNLFTDSQRFQRESQSPRSLLAALGLETPTLPSTQAYLGF